MELRAHGMLWEKVVLDPCTEADSAATTIEWEH